MLVQVSPNAGFGFVYPQYIFYVAEMKYMRRTAGYIWTDYKTNAQIAKELKITPILDKLLEYKKKKLETTCK